MAGLDFIIRGDNSDFLNKLKEIQNGVRSTADKIEQSGMSIEDMFSRLTKAAAAFGAGFSATEFVKQIARVRGEFQQLEVAFTTMLGGSQEAANDLMQQMVKLAATTPFDLQGVADGARQLLAYGDDVNNITDDLTRLGNIAAGLSQPLGDLVYLYGTTMTQGRLYTQDLNQFTGRGIPMIRELAKVFGVTEEEVKNLVTEGKVGFPEVQKVIQNLTNEGGMFYNLMAEQSKTITGQISNIEDNISMMFNNIGKSSEGVINTALSGVSYLVENYESVGEAIMAVVTAYGSYKAVLMSVAAYQSAVTGIRYTTEIAELSKLIPAKQQEAKIDLEQAVASGRLSEAKAAQVAAMRTEAIEYVKSLQLKAQEATANYNAATSASASAALKLEAAETSLAAAQMEYNAAVRSGNAKAIEAAETQLAIAQSDKYSAAKALEAARANVATASTNASTASKAAETASTALNTAATSANTKATNLLTVAKTKLIAVSKALGASLLVNPYVLAAAAITSLVAVIYKFATSASAAEMAQNGFNRSMDEMAKKADERKQKISELISVIKSADTTDLSKQLAFDELKDVAPALTEIYDSVEKIDNADFSNISKAQEEIAGKDKEDELRRQIDLLKEYAETIENSNASFGSRARAVGGLKSLGIEGDMGTTWSDWAEAARKQLGLVEQELQKIEDAKEEMRVPTEMEVKLAKNSYNESKERLDDLEKFALALKDEIEGNAIEIPLDEDSPRRKTDDIVSEIEGKIEALKKEQRDNPIQFTADRQQVLNQYETMLEQIKAWKENARATGVFTIPLFVTQIRNETEQKQQRFNYVTGKYEASKVTDDANNLAKAYKNAEKAYNDARASLAKMEANRGNHTKQEYEKAVEDLKTAKDEFEKLGGTTQTDKQRQSAAAKAANERKKEAEKRKKAQEELDKALLALQQKNQDDEIALMQEGTQKKLAEIDNDYKKRIAEIDKQEAEFKKKNKEAGATGLTGGLTDEQSDELQKARDNATKQQKQDTEKALKEERELHEQSWRDYLKEYGDYQQKREAITEDYNKKIADATKDGDEGLAKSLSAQLEAALRELDFSEFQKAINWDAVFGDLSALPASVLSTLRSQLEAVRGSLSGKGGLSADDTEQLKTLTEAIDRLRSAEISDNPFATLKQGAAEYAQSLKELNDAQATFDKASSQSYDGTQTLAEAFDEALRAQDGAKMAAVENTEVAIEQTDEFGNVTSVTMKYIDALKQLQKAQNSVTTSSSKLGQSINGIGSKMGQIAQIGSNATELFSSLGIDVPDSIGKALGGLGEMGAAMEAFDVNNPGSFLNVNNYINFAKGVVGAFEGIGEAIGGIFGLGGADYSEYYDMKSKYDQLSEVWDELIAKKKEYIDIDYGIEAQKAGTEALELLSQQEAYARRVAEAAAGAGASVGSHSIAYRQNRDLGGYLDEVRQYTKQQDEALTQTLMNASADELAAIKENMYDMWMGLDGDFRAALEDIIAIKEQSEEIRENMNEAFTGTSFDSFYGNYVDMLVDLDNDNLDFAENFEEYLKKSILSSLVANNYRSRIRKLYEDWAAANKDGNIDTSEAAMLREAQKELADEMIADRDSLAETFGWTSDNLQEAGAKGYETISQETGAAIDGRLTAVQITNEQIKDNIIDGVGYLQSISTMVSNSNSTLNDILLQQVDSNSHLTDIASYVKPLSQKLDTLINNIKNL